MKAKETLELYLEQNYNIHSTEWNDLNEVCKNALIIEFFDSVGIYIEVATEGEWDAYVNKEWVKTYCTDRAQATNEAIIKANDLYNENN